MAIEYKLVGRMRITASIVRQLSRVRQSADQTISLPGAPRPAGFARAALRMLTFRLSEPFQ
jgi:hypothetical protein